MGHSTGGGEVARYIGRHGTKRVAKAVLIAAIAADAEDGSESRRVAEERVLYMIPARTEALTRVPEGASR